MSKDLVAEQLKRGWVHVKMYFEVLAGDEGTAKSSLRQHIDQVKKMDTIKIVSEKFEDVVKVENPPKKFEGKNVYSQVADIEMMISSPETLLYSVIFFGPSSIEIMQPREMKLRQEELQGMANSVAEIMHRYASAGAGGIVISGKKE
jgi:hypothetical protein